MSKCWEVALRVVLSFWVRATHTAHPVKDIHTGCHVQPQPDLSVTDQLLWKSWAFWVFAPGLLSGGNEVEASADLLTAFDLSCASWPPSHRFSPPLHNTELYDTVFINARTPFNLLKNTFSLICTFNSSALNIISNTLLRKNHVAENALNDQRSRTLKDDRTSINPLNQELNSKMLAGHHQSSWVWIILPSRSTEQAWKKTGGWTVEETCLSLIYKGVEML